MGDVQAQGLIHVRKARNTIHQSFVRYFCTLTCSESRPPVLSVYQTTNVGSFVGNARVHKRTGPPTEERSHRHVQVGHLFKQYEIGNCNPWNGKGWQHRYQWGFRLSVRRLRKGPSAIDQYDTKYDTTLEIICQNDADRATWVASTSLCLRAVQYGRLPFNWEAHANLAGGFFMPLPGGWTGTGLDESCKLQGYAEPARFAPSQHVSTLICFTDHNTKTQTFNDPRLFPEIVREPTDIFPQQKGKHYLPGDRVEAFCFGKWAAGTVCVVNRSVVCVSALSHRTGSNN
jgi:hypothetical protein